MLSSKLSYAQSKVKCTDCKNGIATWTQTVSCTNCKSWADSYRNIKGCDVCKNNKVISIRKQAKCTTCNGTTWRVPVRPAPLTKEQQIMKKINDLKLSPRRHVGTFRINEGEYTNFDIIKYKIMYDYSEDNLWYLLGAIMTNAVSYTDYKDKVYALLDYFELMYNYARKSDGWAGDFLYYPTPNDVNHIRYQLEQLNADPNYKPLLLGFGISANDLSELY